MPKITRTAVIVFTDGACQGNQWRQSRIAGWGAFWSDNHPFNWSYHLEGEEQTNNRAELQAVVYVLQVEIRRAEVRTDSAYVFKGITEGMKLWKELGWQTTSGKQVSNADLWKKLDKLLERRPAQSLL
eukprot:12410762-Karenia_brevis.AAC.1